MNTKAKTAVFLLCAFFIISACQSSAPAFVESVQEPEPSAASKFADEAVFAVELPAPVQPHINTASMRIGNINSNRAEIVVTINVENPNGFEISPPTITYDYHLNKNSFIRGIIESENLLAASSVTPVVFRLFVSYSDLYRNYIQLRTSALKEIPSFLTMTCDYENPDFTWEMLNFELTGTLPLVR